MLGIVDSARFTPRGALRHEPPFGAGRFAMRASTLALALIRIHLFPPKRNHNIDTKNIGIMAFLLQNKGVLPFFIDFLAKM
ncbi:MAG: hypothetical protein SOR64_05610 [Eubacteriales bacterium]|nr:hypothetical protein [Eubacteriales bacterium]